MQISKGGRLCQASLLISITLLNQHFMKPGKVNLLGLFRPLYARNNIGNIAFEKLQVSHGPIILFFVQSIVEDDVQAKAIADEAFKEVSPLCIDYNPDVVEQALFLVAERKAIKERFGVSSRMLLNEEQERWLVNLKIKAILITATCSHPEDYPKWIQEIVRQSRK